MSAEATRGASDVPGQVLVFAVSGQELGVPLERVSEIVPYERVSELPGAPPWVRGVAQVRGRVIPVVDLAVRLGRQPAPAGNRTCILMFELTRASEPPLVVGVVMDSVAKLIEVDRCRIAPPPRFEHADARPLLAGLVPAEGGMLPLLDVGRVLEPDQLAAVEAAAAGPERR